MNRAALRAAVGMLLAVLVAFNTTLYAQARVPAGAEVTLPAPPAQYGGGQVEQVHLSLLRGPGHKASLWLTAKASVTPQIQYLNDTAGTVFTFTVRNTSSSATIGAVEIERPSSHWKIVACPQAPPGWSVQRSSEECRYRSTKSSADDIKPGQSSSAFQVRATTDSGSANRFGTWEVDVSRSNQFDSSSKRAASAEPPGLGIVVYAWQILDAVVDATPRAPGSPCPAATAANHSASAGAAGQTVVICGRNRMSSSGTPQSWRSSLGGSFIASAGSFSSGWIRANSSSSVVLGTWRNVTITASPGADKTIVARVGSASYRTSPLTTLNGYDATSDPPVAAGDSFAVDEGGSLNVPAPGVLANDSDPNGAPLTAALVSAPAHGTLTLNPDGSFTYTPAADYSGPDSFTYRAQNPNGAQSAVTTVAITVNPVNDGPTAAGQSVSTGEGAAAAITLAGSDPDGDSLSFALVSGPSNGSLSAIGAPSCASGSCTASVTYTPDAGYSGPDSFTFTVNDGVLESAPATVSISVSAVDDAPVAVDDTATVAEDAAAMAIDVLANDTDADGGPISIAAVTQPANGTVAITGGGSGLTYQPDPGFCAAAPDSFTYTLAPGGSVATVEVTVTCVNDPPSFALPASPDQSVVQDAGPQSVAGFASSISAGPANEAGQALTFNVSSDNAALFAAQPAISAATGALTYTPAAGQTGTATVSVFLSDDGGTANGGVDASPTVSFQIAVRPPNAEPVVTPASFALDENSADGTSVGAVSASDPDAGQTVTFAITGGNTGDAFAIDPSSGAITVADSAALDFETTPSFSLTVTATDNGATPASGSATITITLNDLNEAPTALALSNASVGENLPSGATVGTLSTADPDAGDTHTYTLATGAGDADNGAFQIVGDTLVTNAVFDFETQSSYSVRVRTTDSGGLFFEQQLTISVAGGNDAPVATDDSYNTVEGAPLAIAAPGVLGNDSDPEGDALTAVLVSGPSNAADFTLNADGSFSYTPSAGATADSFTYVANDGALDSNTATVTIGINTRPTASAQSVSADEDTPLLITLSGSDGEDADLSFAIVTGPSNGSLGAIGAPNCSALNSCTATVTYTPAAEYSGPDSFSFTVNDGASDSAPATVSITVNAVNDAPVLAGVEGAALGFTEGGAPVAVTGAITVSDADSATISGATVTISAGYQSGADLLAFADQLGITGSFDGGTGVLTLSGSAPLADYETALRAVTYANTSEAPSGASRTISFMVNDGAADSNSASRQVTVTAVNDPPVNTVPGAQSVDEDTDLVFSVANGNPISVADADAGTGDIQVTVSALNGTLTPATGSGAAIGGSGTGSVTIEGTLAEVNAALNGLAYRGDLHYNESRGAETLTVLTSDEGNTGTGGALSDSDGIDVSVSAVNDAPVALAKSFVAHTNMRLALGGLLTGATDPDSGDSGYTPTFTVGTLGATAPAGGTISNLSASAGSFDFDPPPGVTGDVTFTYTVCDSGAPAPALCSAPATVTVSVSGPVIWFVDDSAPAGGDGRLSSPFNSLAAAAAVDGASHRIFLYSGSYATGIALNTSEQLIGQGVSGAGFDGVFGITPPATTIARPSIGGARPSVGGQVSMAGNSVVRGLNIAPPSGTQGLSASGASGLTVGEVSVTAASAVAVNLTNASGAFSFTRVDANGGASGIIWNNASAATGSLTVSGTASGSDRCGGSVSNTTPGTLATVSAPVPAECTGGTIQNSSGVGIVLNNVANVSLSRVRVLNYGTDGITVNNINGFTLSNALVSDNSPAPGSGRGVAFGNFSTGTAVSGAINITSSTVTMAQHDNLAVGIGSGSSTWTISGSSFSLSGGNGGGGGTYAIAGGNSGINFSLVGNASVSATVSGNSITGNYADGIQFDSGAGSGTLTATISNNSFNNNNIAMDLNALNAATMTYTVQNNTIENLNRRSTGGVNGASHAVNVFQGTPSSGVLTLRFTGNSIGDSSIAGSGSSFGNCLRVNFNAGSAGAANGVVLIDGNTMRQCPVGRGIEVIGRNGNGRLDVTITNNTVDHTNLAFNPGTSDFPLAAIFVQSHETAPGSGTSYRVRSDVRGNTVPGGMAFDLTTGYISLAESQAGGNSSIHELVDSPAGPGGETPAQQLAGANTGSAGVVGGVALIPGPIVTPP